MQDKSNLHASLDIGALFAFCFLQASGIFAANIMSRGCGSINIARAFVVSFAGKFTSMWLYHAAGTAATRGW